MTEPFLTSRIGIENVPEVSYIIFTTPRSGSTFLCDLLRKTKLAGKPGEHFLHWYRTECKPEQINPIEAPFRLLPPTLQLQRAIKRGTRDGVFGVKVMSSYFGFVETSIQNLSGLVNRPARESFEFIFPNLHYIFLSRRSKIQQSVSLARAVLSNEWRRDLWSPFSKILENIPATPKRKSGELLYDFDKILGFYKEMCRQDQEWNDYFKKAEIEPYLVIYEDLLQNVDGSVKTILKYLGRKIEGELKLSRIFLKKQGDSINEEWSERFQRDLGRINAK
jgi:Uncharacterized protein conserved in bacteria